METTTVTNLDDINHILSQNSYHANGKNFKIDYLYQTVANSRWNYENIFGIYLAKPEYAWMAFWMAITSREMVRKRQIQYISPRGKDSVGNIVIYNPENLSLDDMLCEKAYLYLFDIDTNIEVLDLTTCNSVLQAMFVWSKIERGDVIKTGYKPLFRNKTLVDIDRWQVALVNYEKYTPIKEIILSKKLIKELKHRIIFTQKEIGKNYII